MPPSSWLQNEEAIIYSLEDVNNRMGQGGRFDRIGQHGEVAHLGGPSTVIEQGGPSASGEIRRNSSAARSWTFPTC
jgi:hypothetical protein